MFASDKQHKALVDAFRSGSPLTYKKGEFIIRPGDTPSGVFYITKGLVKAYDITKYGEENLLIIRKENEIFPLIWSITGQGRHIIYQALSDVEVLRLEQTFFQGLLRDDPTLQAPFMDIVFEMYRIHSERIMNLEYRTVRERLMSFLLIMADRFGHKTKLGICIEAPLKQQDIASSINATRETTGRELAHLTRRGLIDHEQGHIVVVDPQKLRDFL
jgi:CRP/FNR family transcriptional regulator